MDLIQLNFPNVGVDEGQLPEDVVDNIWKVVNEAREQPEDMKPELAANISKSIRLDGDSPLLKEFVSELLPSFIQSHIEAYGAPWRETMREGEGWNLESLWVNFQKQHEFNPPHDHSGVYSFVIWMQIPTSFKEQRKLPIAANSNASTQISNFAFTYTDILGNICSFIYNMEKQAEGFMVLFPASLHHLVNPFYNNDGERISISGNISVV